MCRLMTPLLVLAAAAMLLAMQQSALAGRSTFDRGNGKVEPHSHGLALVTGRSLVTLAARSGDLKAGLAALGLQDLPRQRALEKASLMLRIVTPDFGTAYANLRAFRAAAFAGPKENGAWVRAAVKAMRSQAPATYVTLRAGESEEFLRAAGRERLQLRGIRLLISVHRKVEESPALLGQMLKRRNVWGIDVVGKELEPQNPAELNKLVDVLLASPRRRPVLRIHAGEGFMGAGGEDNVNIVLRALADRAATTPELRRIRVIVGHAAKIRDLPAASRDLQELTRLGVKVDINPNPLSNYVYGAVPSVADIAAFKLGGARLIAGSDNCGTLRDNVAIVKKLQHGDTGGAVRLAERVAKRLARGSR